jgi:DNA-binding transcriptional MocR family regulator
MRLTADDLAGRLLESRARTGPLHRQLSDGLRELIDLGEVPTDALLPPERALAAALSVSRTTVVAAYQTLRQDGLLVRRQGSGTRVRGAAWRGDRETVSARVLSGGNDGDLEGDRLLRGPRATIDFSTAALPCLPLVPEVAATLTKEDYAALASGPQGYQPRGLRALRERIAAMYAAGGVPTAPDQILVTSGAQQALELIAHGCLTTGDSVVTDAPTYRGALEAFRLANCRIRAVPCDDQGMDVEQVEQLVDDRRLRLIYVQSCVHNPTGTVLAPGRRRRLARIAEQHQVVVVDDTALAGTLLDGSLLDGAQPASLAELTRSERILTLGSMSKLYWCGLRLGWIRGSVQVIARLAQMKGVTDLGTSLISQQIAVSLLNRQDEAQTLRRRQLTEGLDILTGLLRTHLPDWTWRTPRGGASLWVRVPTGSVTNFAHVAARYGVAILPGTAFAPGDVAGSMADDHTRLPYVLPTPTLATGVQRLARAWAAYVDGRSGVPLASVTT